MTLKEQLLYEPAVSQSPEEYNILSRIRTALFLVCSAEAKIPVEDWLNPTDGQPMMGDGQMG